MAPSRRRYRSYRSDASAFALALSLLGLFTAESQHRHFAVIACSSAAPSSNALGFNPLAAIVSFVAVCATGLFLAKVLANKRHNTDRQVLTGPYVARVEPDPSSPTVAHDGQDQPWQVVGERRVQFNPMITGHYVPDTTELPEREKADVWWQQEDFQEFLRVRIEIGQAYKKVAKQLGVDIIKVSCSGAYGYEGYKAMVQAMPELAGESRRGLGLGRKRQRAKSRDAYIRAILDEQKRLKEEAFADGRPFLLPSGALSRTASKVSDKDTKYAHFLAKQYYEQDLLDDCVEVQPQGSIFKQQSSPCSVEPARQSSDETSARNAQLAAIVGGNSFTTVRGASFLCLSDDEERDKQLKKSFSKGYGLSREKLQQYGLSANGHHLARRQLKSRLPEQKPNDDSDASDAGESAAEGGDDNSDMEDREDFVSEYRNWRMGSSNLGGGDSSTLSESQREYGTRDQYRVWRAQQAARTSK